MFGNFPMRPACIHIRAQIKLIRLDSNHRCSADAACLTNHGVGIQLISLEYHFQIVIVLVLATKQVYKE